MSTKKSVLVTGGAGYIGSHVVLQLRERGERVVILDNLSTGFRQAAGDATLVVGDVGDMQLVDRVLAEHDVDTVMHFAAKTIVPESVRQPLMYYYNNTSMTRNLLESCMRGNVRKFVFSSTAAVYGMPEGGVAREEALLAPINPYGTSKLMSEWILRDLSAVTDFRYVSLRYFNVAGSDPDCRVGQATAKATLLIKVACEHVVGKRSHISIYGTDYPHPGRHGGARLHPRAGPGECPSRCTRLPASRWRIHGAQLRVRTRLQRARGTRERGPCVGQEAGHPCRAASRGRPTVAGLACGQYSREAGLDAQA